MHTPEVKARISKDLLIDFLGHLNARHCAVLLLLVMCLQSLVGNCLDPQNAGTNPSLATLLVQPHCALAMRYIKLEQFRADVAQAFAIFVDFANLPNR